MTAEEDRKDLLQYATVPGVWVGNAEEQAEIEACLMANSIEARRIFQKGDATTTSIPSVSNDISFTVITNDGTEKNSIWLMGAKKIFATQLPKMPREYIVRLVFKVLALVGFAYGRLISITGNKSALASENGTMNYHQAAHVAALQSVDVATTNHRIQTFFNYIVTNNCLLELYCSTSMYRNATFVWLVWW